jgi:putative peptidoglycan lipid II flippase
MIFAGISMAANIVLSFTLFMALGATGIAIATMLSGWINVALLVATLRRRERFKLDQTFRRRCAGILAASAVMGVVVFALVKFLEPWFAPASGLVAQGTALVTLVATGLLVYLGTAHLFGAAQFRDLIKD